MRTHGYIISVDGDGKTHEADSLQCPHCGAHFVSIPGSGARRAWCYMCHAVTCGNPVCDVHNPFEKQMEAMEKQAIIIARG